MRTFLLGVSAVSFVVCSFVACSGGAGDVPTQRGVSLSSGGTDNGGGGSNSGGSKGNGGSSDTAPASNQCQLGAACDCDGQPGIVTQCVSDEATCTCSGGRPDGG